MPHSLIHRSAAKQIHQLTKRVEEISIRCDRITKSLDAFEVPSAILNLFQKTSSCHYYNTRASASGNFYVNSSDLELYKLSFSRFGAKLWNEIPYSIRQLPKNKFKKTLRKLLFDILDSEEHYIDTPTLIKKVKLAKNVEK